MSRRIVMPPHTNHRGTLFGGMALAWIDEETAIVAATAVGTTDIVTKLMSEVEFKAPAQVGDIIELDCKVTAVGRTSLTVDCLMRDVTTGKEIVKVEKVVYVALYKDGSARPHGKTIDSIDPSLVRAFIKPL